MRVNSLKYLMGGLLIGGICLAGSAYGEKGIELFQAGNKAYLEGNFRDALTLWKQAEEAGVDDGALFYNMGNAYYRMGEPGEAILYWEKAYRRLRADPDVVANLQFIRRQLSIPQEEVVRLPIWDLIDRFLTTFPPTFWSYVLLIVTYTIFLLLALRRWFLKSLNAGLIAQRLIWSALTILILTSLFLYLHARNERVNRSGIILNPQVEVMSSPSAVAAKLLFILPEGTKCQLLRSVGDYYEVRLSKEKQGWVKKEDLGII